MVKNRDVVDDETGRRVKYPVSSFLSKVIKSIKFYYYYVHCISGIIIDKAGIVKWLLIEAAHRKG